MNYYLAVDVGASSGRLILSYKENDKMVLEEVYRFKNGMQKKDGKLIWDLNSLFSHIIEGMKKCKEIGKIPCSIGIDTWGVDYVLVSENGQVIGDTYGYRDKRTKGMDEEVYKIISQEELYRRTGIQKQIFNTIYQLMSVKQNEPEYFEQADSLLMIPDYLNFLLTGIKATEYTNATTTQLVNPKTMDWDRELIRLLGYPEKIFNKIYKPGTCLGQLKEDIVNTVGYDCKVILPATHDTGSAVMAIPGNEEHLVYISSGTWSLMGTELKEANCSSDSMKNNFTNEGGYEGRIRYLKNIMGMWMINSVKEEIAPDISFEEICRKASKEKIRSLIDVNDDRFLSPDSMVSEVQNACYDTGQQVPKDIAQLSAVIYNSLAYCYAETIKEIEKNTGVKAEAIYVFGGGCKANYLNGLTAKMSRKQVIAGPVEATAIGNLLAQMISEGECKDLSEARDLVMTSFGIRMYY